MRALSWWRRHSGVAITIALLWIAANAFTIWYVSQEQIIYFWDWVGHWQRVVQLREVFLGNPLRGITDLFVSIRVMDYNLVPAACLLPLSLLVGTERLPYILILLHGFAIPAIALFVWWCRATLTHDQHAWSASSTILIVVTILLYPLFWLPILRGYVGVGGLIFAHLVLLLYCRKPLADQRASTLMSLGLLLGALVLFRRWYAYWSVGFLIAALMDAMISSFAGHRPWGTQLRMALMKWGLLVGSSAALVFIMAWGTAVRMLITDYADIYSSSRALQVTESLQAIPWHMGSGYLALAGVGACYSLCNARLRRLTGLLIIQCLVIITLLIRTQDFYQHQYYLLQPTLFFFICVLVYQTGLWLRRSALRLVFGLGYTLVAAVSMAVVFVPQASSLAQPLQRWLPQVRAYPLVRQDMTEINRLVSRMEALVGGTDNLVYVLSSSHTFNYDTLARAYLSIPRGKLLKDRVLPTHDIDKRDGFPSRLLATRYVLVAWPIQYHVRPGDQRVVGIPAEQMMAGQGIGRSYRQLPDTFMLDGEVMVYLYEKIQPVTKSDLQELMSALQRHYPKRPYIYQATALEVEE